MLQVPRAGGEWGIGDVLFVVMYFSFWSPTTPGSENSVAGEGGSRGPCQRQQFLSPVSLGGGGEGSNKSKGLARATAPPYQRHHSLSIVSRGGGVSPPLPTTQKSQFHQNSRLRPSLGVFFHEKSDFRTPEGRHPSKGTKNIDLSKNIVLCFK